MTEFMIDGVSECACTCLCRHMQVEAIAVCLCTHLCICSCHVCDTSPIHEMYFTHEACVCECSFPASHQHDVQCAVRASVV
jgi:hypothetical protein